MVRLLLSVFIFIAGQISSYCQEQNEEKILFSEALSLHLDKYEKKQKLHTDTGIITVENFFLIP